MSCSAWLAQLGLAWRGLLGLTWHDVGPRAQEKGLVKGQGQGDGDEVLGTTDQGQGARDTGPGSHPNLKSFLAPDTTFFILFSYLLGQFWPPGAGDHIETGLGARLTKKI